MKSVDSCWASKTNQYQGKGSNSGCSQYMTLTWCVLLPLYCWAGLTFSGRVRIYLLVYLLIYYFCAMAFTGRQTGSTLLFADHWTCNFTYGCLNSYDWKQFKAANNVAQKICLQLGSPTYPLPTAPTDHRNMESIHTCPGSNSASAWGPVCATRPWPEDRQRWASVTLLLATAHHNSLGH